MAGAWHVTPRPDLADLIKEGTRWCRLAAHVSRHPVSWGVLFGWDEQVQVRRCSFLMTLSFPTNLIKTDESSGHQC
jgi:hypothetical protein